MMIRATIPTASEIYGAGRAGRFFLGKAENPWVIQIVALSMENMDSMALFST